MSKLFEHIEEMRRVCEAASGHPVSRSDHGFVLRDVERDYYYEHQPEKMLLVWEVVKECILVSNITQEHGCLLCGGPDFGGSYDMFPITTPIKHSDDCAIAALEAASVGEG